MAKLPRPSGKDMVRLLQHQGFVLIHVRGSHHYFKKGKQRTSVPVHGNRPLKIGTLRSILRDINASPAQFKNTWGRKGK